MEVLLTGIPFAVVYDWVLLLLRFVDCLDSHLIGKGLLQTVIATESPSVPLLALNPCLQIIVESWRDGRQLIFFYIDRSRRLLN